MRLEDMRTLMTQTMTMDTLTNAMREFLTIHAEHLLDMFQFVYPGITQDEAVERALIDLATGDVLRHINNNLKILPVAELEVEGEDVTKIISNMEIAIGHGINYTDKLFSRPVFLAGECMNSCGGNDVYTCTDMQYTFLTIDGEWRTVNADIIQEFRSTELYFSLKMYKESDDTSYYGLEYLKDLIPTDYEYVLYDYI